MSRHVFQGIAQDGNGKIIASAQVTAYLAGTATPATLYDSTTAVTPNAGGVVLSGIDGKFIFYIDSDDYMASQLFDVTIAKANYATQTWPDCEIFWIGTGSQDTGSAAPIAGTWPLGWVRWNTAPVAGGNAFWICTAAGTPGTWKEGGLINA